jgi:hypothetical protein
MVAVTITTFCKRQTCPATELLLLYHDAALDPISERVVAAHLAECDFCGAELFLLTKYPPHSLPRYRRAPVPEQLYRLARLLLGSAPRVASR